MDAMRHPTGCRRGATFLPSTLLATAKSEQSARSQNHVAQGLPGTFVTVLGRDRVAPAFLVNRPPSFSSSTGRAAQANASLPHGPISPEARPIPSSMGTYSHVLSKLIMT
ncbi:hypothetical protein BP5796_01864 [Coleophoma crateriformis]|uniref:Uncharacterized protein n=1 Tax=Coleophoma crateriformis TaxID=565419 RepID=A0A3D8T1R3_9HELO|nr:hypothetical protein BP5796_01864 [Coleophoma crateriformis]